MMCDSGFQTARPEGTTHINVITGLNPEQAELADSNRALSVWFENNGVCTGSVVQDEAALCFVKPANRQRANRLTLYYRIPIQFTRVFGDGLDDFDFRDPFYFSNHID